MTVLCYNFYSGCVYHYVPLLTPRFNVNKTLHTLHMDADHATLARQRPGPPVGQNCLIMEVCVCALAYLLSPRQEACS